ncbi:MAG: hypothetical protein HFE36_05040 [Clostridia bacterium]|nr:hypothetical protein [Clostridia bacterium]
MIRIICGIPRAGKTALMTLFALQHMKGRQAHQDLIKCKKLLAPLNAGGFNYTPPADHLVFADYTIIAGAKGMITNYEVSGFYLGLFNDKHPTMFLPPNSKIFLDEAQKYFNSRKGIAAFVSRYYELHGHYRLDITCTVQRPKLIDLNVRELAAEVLYVEKLDHEQSGKRILSSQWTCSSFDNTPSAIDYIESGQHKEKRGDKAVFEYDGNIFKHYDSFSFFPAFLNGNEDSTFNLRHAVPTGYTRDEIMDFNDEHEYSVPDTYYEKK